MNAAGFMQQPDIRNLNVLLYCLTHIVHRQRCHRDSSKGFHLYPCFPITFNGRPDSYAIILLLEVEIQIKYAGYLTRQEKQVEEFKKEEARLLPDDLDYAAIPGLRLEAREKLAAIRPVSIGQAGRISGVSPADIAVLLIYLEQTNG